MACFYDPRTDNRHTASNCQSRDTRKNADFQDGETCNNYEGGYFSEVEHDYIAPKVHLNIYTDEDLEKFVLDITSELEKFVLDITSELENSERQRKYERNFYAALLAFYVVMFLMLALGWGHLLGAWEAVTASACVGIACAVVVYIVERFHD